MSEAMRRAVASFAGGVLLGALLGVACLLRWGSPVGRALIEVGVRAASAGGEDIVLTHEQVAEAIEAQVTETVLKMLPVTRPRARGRKRR